MTNDARPKFAELSREDAVELLRRNHAWVAFEVDEIRSRNEWKGVIVRGAISRSARTT